MQKKERQKILLATIASNSISTQAELIELLAQNGVKVTQATLSRDLRELNLTKEKVNGEVRYLNAKEQQDNTTIDQVIKLLKTTLLAIEVVQFMVVIRTNVGDANVFSAYFDDLKLAEVVGTLAGADTVLIITRGKAQAEQLKQKILDWLEKKVE